MEGAGTNGLNALELQIGGNHYKRGGYQPIMLITKLDCTFIQGCIIKYITRYRFKNGLQDINKCIHYAALAKELNSYKTIDAAEISIEVNKYAEQNNLTIIQRKVIMAALINNYDSVIDLCNRLINIEYM